MIFPLTPVETLEDALRSNLNVDFAIDDLLSSVDNNGNPSASGKQSVHCIHKLLQTVCFLILL